MIVRFTDADRRRWQEVQRSELQAFPEEFQHRVICGVAVNNPEDWLALDPGYLASRLGIDADALRDDRRSDAIKKAIGRARKVEGGVKEETEDVVRRLVIDAPAVVFKRWLQDDAFRQFYQDCRRIATRLGCEPEPNNEL